MNTKMTIGNRIEQFARYKFGGIAGLNKKISEISGKKTSIYKYIKDERAPGTTLLIPLANLGCNINWLLLGEGKMTVELPDLKENSELAVEINKLKAQISILKEIVYEYSVKKHL
ncbi:MAG: hypothetical protein QG635_228 [Bacteroidota bacterium]|nr:hypothetical protein [Bacteroidota bacterium]